MRRAGTHLAVLLAAGLALPTPSRAAHHRPAPNPPASATTRSPATAIPVADAAAPPNPAQPGAAQPGAATPGAADPAAGPLGSAVGTLAPRHAKGRSRHAREPMPGCTTMATLDGVSAALQAGPFGRGQGLAIMQFRTVVTDRAEDATLACHSDVLLSDGTLHRADYGLHRLRHGMRLHIEVGRAREDVVAPVAQAAAGGQPAPDAAPAPGAAAPMDRTGPRVPAT